MPGNRSLPSLIDDVREIQNRTKPQHEKWTESEEGSGKPGGGLDRFPARLMMYMSEEAGG